MKVQTPPLHIQPQPNPVVPGSAAPQRRLALSDLADLTQATASAAPRPVVQIAQAETRPLRPGSILDIKV
jgi:hypothetical protein